MIRPPVIGSKASHLARGCPSLRGQYRGRLEYSTGNTSASDPSPSAVECGHSRALLMMGRCPPVSSAQQRGGAGNRVLAQPCLPLCLAPTQPVNCCNWRCLYIQKSLFLLFIFPVLEWSMVTFVTKAAPALPVQYSEGRTHPTVPLL